MDLRTCRCRLLLFLTAFIVFLSAATVYAAKPNGLIVLLTDYGDTDYFASALKGEIYSKFPEAKIDSITNQVPSYNIHEGAYLLASASLEFPPGTVFCVVLDPGEGADKRRSVVIETEDGKYYVGPDNGFLTLVLENTKVKKAYEIANPMFISGANVYGPAAANLAKGIPIETAGPVISDLTIYKVAEPILNFGILSGEVLHVDASGNILTNIPRELVEKLGMVWRKNIRIQLGGELADIPFVRNYADVGNGDWLALINASGKLEIARNRASANAILQVHAGTPVQIRL